MLTISNNYDAALRHLQHAADPFGIQRCSMRTGSECPRSSRDTSLPALQYIIKSKSEGNSDSIKRPDIEWLPSYSVYKAREARLANSAKNRHVSLPQGWPGRIDAPWVWTGADFEDPETYIIQLSGDDRTEIHAALEHFKSLPGEQDPDSVSSSTFPLPKLGIRLRNVAQNVHRGTGFNVIRGLDPADYTALDNVYIYLGITSYIAPRRGCQDYDGTMICHIKDIAKGIPDSMIRSSPYTSLPQPFHNDQCDVLAMYVLDTAAAGGESLLASSGMIYNELAASRPDLIHSLAKDDWIFDDFAKTTASWSTRPLLYNFEGSGPSFCFARRPLTGAPFSPHGKDVPAMSEEQAEAIDAVHFTAVKHQLAIRLQPGDIEIFNNKALMHARNGFVDAAGDLPEAQQRPGKSSSVKNRHMLRLWLRSDDESLVWSTPEPLRAMSHAMYGDSEARKIAKWDIGQVPPINRTLEKHFECS